MVLQLKLTVLASVLASFAIVLAACQNNSEETVKSEPPGYESIEHYPLYCRIIATRNLVDQGNIDFDELQEEIPDWVEPWNGEEPVIIDIRYASPGIAPMLNDTLRIATEDLTGDSNAGEEEFQSCMETVNSEIIEDTEGPYRGGDAG